MSKVTIKIGDKFETKYGVCTVIDYKNCDNVYIKFQNTGSISKTNTTDLRKGNVKDYEFPTVEGFGYFGHGDFKSRENNKISEYYSVWQGMIKRCYNPIILKKEPSYRDCEVCSEWANFQVFAQWMQDQEYRKQGWHLDKDLIEFNNKLYCPDKCIFIPACINKCLVTNRNNPNAGIKKLKSGNFLVNMSIKNHPVCFGTFESLQEAKDEYKKRKLEYLINLAEQEGVPDFITSKFESYINNQQNEKVERT